MNNFFRTNWKEKADVCDGGKNSKHASRMSSTVSRKTQTDEILKKVRDLKKGARELEKSTGRKSE